MLTAFSFVFQGFRMVKSCLMGMPTDYFRTAVLFISSNIKRRIHPSHVHLAHLAPPSIAAARIGERESFAPAYHPPVLHNTRNGKRPVARSATAATLSLEGVIGEART